MDNSIKNDGTTTTETTKTKHYDDILETEIKRKSAMTSVLLAIAFVVLLGVIGYLYKDHLRSQRLIGYLKFTSGVCWVTNDEGKYGLINSNGDVVADYQFAAGMPFAEGHARVSKKDGDGFVFAYIDSTGKVISKWYDNNWNFKEGMGRVQKEYQFSFINAKGDTLKDWFDKAEDFSNGVAKVSRLNKFTFLFKDGKLPFDWYDDIQLVSDSVAYVKTAGQCHIMNIYTKFVSKAGFDQIGKFSDKAAMVVKDKKMACISRVNAEVVSEWFDKIYVLSNGFAVAVRDKKYGFLDENGKIAIKLTYDDASYFTKEGYSIVKKNGKTFWIDKNEKCIGGDCK